MWNWNTNDSRNKKQDNSWLWNGCANKRRQVQDRSYFVTGIEGILRLWLTQKEKITNLEQKSNFKLGAHKPKEVGADRRRV